jgi:NAD(P)-dependent dehydrogenase (short-subunit alcohol dehydrogenase family)
MCLMSESSSYGVGGQRPAVVLIGPGRYFGAEVLQRFAVEGFGLGAISGSASGATNLDAVLQSGGLAVHTEVADVTNAHKLANSVERLAKHLGGIECLIYNPKVSVAGTGLSTTPDELRYSLDVNVVGALTAVQAALPYLEKSRRPCVILTGGGFKDRPDVDRFALSVGKSGIHAVSRALIGPLQTRGIRIKTIVIDGFVRTGGPIEPGDLADYYWRVYTSERRHVFRYSPADGVDQLAFDFGV